MKYFVITISAADRLDLNITSAFITMIQNTLKSWSEDYYGPSFLDSSQNKQEHDPQLDLQATPSDSTATEGNAGHFKKRAPFVWLFNITQCCSTIITILCYVIVLFVCLFVCLLQQ